MNKKLIYCALLGFAALVGHCNAQSIRLTRYRSRTNVTLDLNRVYNYNIYERNRWGLGVNLVQPLKYDKRYGTAFQNSFIAAAYAGYGSGDHAWKYGGEAGLVFPRAVLRGFSVYYQHDLLRVGSHSFDEYNIFNTTDNSSYFSSRYAGVDLVALHAQFDIPGPGMLHLGYSHSRERLLFDASGLLYPSIYDDDAMPYETFDEAGLDLYWGDHWKLGVLAGVTDRDKAKPYARALAQYSNRLDFGDSVGNLRLFAQGGLTLSDNTPLSRRFDLGGTGGGFYYFNNTFLTVRPNTFAADAFVLASIRFTSGWSPWTTYVSEPHPFVQLNAMWGGLYGNSVVDGTGTYTLYGTEPPGYIALTAPYAGLVEPCIGINGLLNWGVLDLGVAAACQLTPKNSSYHIDNFWDKFAVMCVAKLII